MTFKIVVAGQPGVGKSTFIVGAYTLANRGTTADSLIAADDPSRDLISRVSSSYRNFGTLPPTDLDQFIQFDFAYLPDGTEHKSAPTFSWLDYSGEYFALVRKGDGLSLEKRQQLYANIAQSDACCVMVDGEAAIAANEAFVDDISKLRECLRFVWQARRASRHPYPFALVFTKSDRLPTEKKDIATLEGQVPQLMRYLSSELFVSKSFLSSVQAEKNNPKDPEYQIHVEHAPDAMFWLIRHLLWIYNPPSNVRRQRLPGDVKYKAVTMCKRILDWVSRGK